MEHATAQAQHLAQQAGEQVSNVTSEWRVQMSERSIQMRDRLTDSMRTLSSELRQMASMPSTSGTMGHTAARQSAELLERTARALDSREPADWISETRSYARRHPGRVMSTFFIGGLLLGRIARSSGTRPSAQHTDMQVHQESVDLRAAEPGYLP